MINTIMDGIKSITDMAEALGEFPLAMIDR